MKILAIETSCDETSAAILEKKENKIIVLSNVTATSLQLHSITGGIIPENAARMQVKYIMPVIIDTLIKSQNDKSSIPIFNYYDDKKTSINIDEDILKNANSILKNNIDAIAVTYGPGLIGSLLVGVETAKTLSFVFDKPLTPINHLLAHIYANFISNSQLSIVNSQFPFIGLIVSGGHTDLLYFVSNEKFNWLGGTRDDAAGEAMDKIGRLLEIPYPAGPEIERRASLAKEKKLRFKSPLISSDDYDFSFSGLKTEVLRFVQNKAEISEDLKNEICFATQKAIIDVLVRKTLKAVKEYNSKNILVGGGVSANQSLKQKLESETSSQKLGANIFFPEKKYSTDNAAMIGAYALINGKSKPWQDVNANPELYFG